MSEQVSGSLHCSYFLGLLVVGTSLYSDHNSDVKSYVILILEMTYFVDTYQLHQLQ